MSKKQSKSVESVGKVAFCKDCRNRDNGAVAKRKGICGFCGKVKSFVNRKHDICDQFKAKPNA